MELKIDFACPLFEEDIACAITPEDLNDFYSGANELDTLNLFFMLEASFHKYLSEDKHDLASHLAFLIAYYVFIPLTPPASYHLALHYINEAIKLSPHNENYENWREMIKNGN